MTELIWLNGQIMPLADARVSVEDRGFQFADGIYEVIRIYNGRPFTLPQHLQRLARSCGGIDMDVPPVDFAGEITKLIAQSEVTDGMVYLQITRGAAVRSHIFPGNCRPTVLFYTRQLPPMDRAGCGSAVKLHGVVDERWRRCWIKSIALLPNTLAKNLAVAAGADEAVFVDDGWVTECSASNILIVLRGALITHPVGAKVLPGITRQVLLELAREIGVPVFERPFTEAELLMSDEAFITSTTRECSWVSHYNGKPLSQAKCGATTMQLHLALQAKVKRETC